MVSDHITGHKPIAKKTHIGNPQKKRNYVAHELHLLQITVSEMTYTVSSGTLNSTIPILLQLTAFRLTCVTANIPNVFFWLECRPWYVRTTGHVMASSTTRCSTPAHTSIRRWFKSFTSCTFVCWTRCWLMQYAPDVFNWIEVIAAQRPQIWRDECMAVWAS